MFFEQNVHFYLQPKSQSYFLPQAKDFAMKSKQYTYNLIISTTIAFLLVSPNHSFPATLSKINPSVDLTYAGAFRVPVDSSSNYAWAWVTKHGLTFNPYGNGGKGSLISPPMENSNSKYFSMVTEFSIPEPVISPTKDISSLPVANTINDWKDITEGKYDQGQLQKRLGGVIVAPKKGTQVTNKLYWITSDWYNPPFNFPTLGMSDLNFNTPNAQGPWIISGSWAPELVPSAKTSKYLLNIPQIWADQYVNGYSIGAGENKPNNNGSRGACLYAIKPWDTDNPPWISYPKGSALPVPPAALIDSKELLCPGMDKTQRRNYDGSLWEEFSYSDGQYDAIWVDNATNGAIIFSGDVGYLPAKDTGVCDLETGGLCEYYKDDNPPGDPDMPICSYPPTCPASPDACDSGDFRAEPYWRVLWFYDINDITEVAQGLKKSWEPQPYSVFNLEEYLFFESRCTKKHIGGITYDPATKRIFITELKVDYTVSPNDPTPIIHVFKVADSTSGPDITPPTQIDTITFLKRTEGIELTWEPAIDNKGPLMYIVHRNGKPIGITTKESFLDINTEYFSTPYSYMIETRDSVNNISIGNWVTTTGEMSTNPPIIINDIFVK